MECISFPLVTLVIQAVLDIILISVAKQRKKFLEAGKPNLCMRYSREAPAPCLLTSVPVKTERNLWGSFCKSSDLCFQHQCMLSDMFLQIRIVLPTCGPLKKHNNGLLRYVGPQQSLDEVLRVSAISRDANAEIGCQVHQTGHQGCHRSPWNYICFQSATEALLFFLPQCPWDWIPESAYCVLWLRRWKWEA